MTLPSINQLLLRSCMHSYMLCPVLSCALQTRSEWVDVDIELHSLLNDGYAQVKDMLARNRWGLPPAHLGAVQEQFRTTCTGHSCMLVAPPTHTNKHLG
jgi:hypothetical protein